MGSAGFSTRKAILFSLVPSLVVLLLAFATAEIGLRIRYATVASITGVTEWKNAESIYFWDVYNPLYGWTNLPRYRSDDRVPYKVTINGQGLRAPRDYSPHPAAGINRIAVIGDSCTFGEDVDDDQTLPYYLEQYLNGSEIMNFGVHGYGLGEMVLQLENEVFKYNPNHILLVLTLPYDLGRITLKNFGHPKPAFTLEAGKLIMRNVPVPTAGGQPFYVKQSFVAAWLFGRTQLGAMAHADEKVLAVSSALLDRARRVCSARGIPLTVITITGPAFANEMIMYDSAREMVSAQVRMVNENGVRLSDQSVFLLDTLRNEPDIFDIVATSKTPHWAGRGNCLLAGNMAADLVRMYPDWSQSRNPPACVQVKPKASRRQHM